MPRLELALPLLAVLPLACLDDKTAMTTGTTTATTTTATATTATDGTTDAATTAGPTTENSTGVTDTTTATDGTTVDPTATTSPTEPGTTTVDTDDGVCGVDGPNVRAELVHEGQPGACGPLEFTGTRLSDQNAPVWQLDGCPCGSDCLIPDPWSFTVEAPAAWRPLLPECPRIVVDTAEDVGGCRFVAVSVWDLDAPGEPAIYHAGHGFFPTQAAADELEVNPHGVETCTCDEGCCNSSQLWDLQFNFVGQDITLAEGESGAVGDRDAINFESHQLGICDAPNNTHWAIRKPA